MKTSGLLLIKILFFVAILNSVANAGTEGGNGGDFCEPKIYEVKDDINLWFDSGAAANLKLPAGITVKDYVTRMRRAFRTAKVSCVDETLKVGMAEKTCKNSGSLIKCNTKRLFSALNNPGELYEIIHHEYAGIAGLETNVDEASDYFISKQLTGFLEAQIVTKLVFKPDFTSASILACTSNSTTSFNALISDGHVNFRALKTDGLPLATALGIAKEQSVTNVRFKVPTEKCSFDYLRGRMSCKDINVSLVFSNVSGRVDRIFTSHLTVSAGTIGVGQDSVQQISISFEVNDKVYNETQTFRTLPLNKKDGTSAWQLCGRPAI